ncbi:hypothetical protein PF008_g31580 [Phytophthora fragariae]|uniref:Uncharacterized protein n=1 Tax=Phytophthora fragariae TaxID=53985 RepID=A0A6G0Q2C5_9STRA|nr:hypothetical protein PF008_g31580 [Phytophthora fragariae]
MVATISRFFAVSSSSCNLTWAAFCSNSGFRDSASATMLVSPGIHLNKGWNSASSLNHRATRRFVVF